VFTRRGFVKLVGTGAALAACGDNIRVLRSGLFLDERGYETIDIATELIFPGARDAQAVRYIDTLLAAFDVDPPAIFASGPYSGRTAFPNPDGTASSNLPANSFAEYLPLPRIKDLAWRMRVFGSAQTTGGDFNDALLGPTIGYRDLYTDGIMRLDAVAMTITANTPFRSLAAPDQGLALDTVASDAPAFYQALVEHTLEGTFAAPEYGGNTLVSGWKLAQYDGDSAPLGHAVYVAALDAYVDRVDQPTSRPSPGAVREDFDDDILDILTVAALGSGGKRFF
jgi:Gluconate 2-dehydrogenase subunit 3